jgi:hypothetical protein
MSRFSTAASTTDYSADFLRAPATQMPRLFLQTRVRRMNAWISAASIMILVSGAITPTQAELSSTTLSPAALALPRLRAQKPVEGKWDRSQEQTKRSRCTFRRS